MSVFLLSLFFVFGLVYMYVIFALSNVQFFY